MEQSSFDQDWNNQTGIIAVVCYFFLSTATVKIECLPCQNKASTMGESARMKHSFPELWGKLMSSDSRFLLLKIEKKVAMVCDIGKKVGLVILYCIKFS